MAVTWSSPIPLPGLVAQAMQILLGKVGAFELTAGNLPEVEALNSEYALIKDIDTGEVASLEPLIGFQWCWASRG